ncbi:MAG: primosomal protein N' [Oscillospiraceae bacterium]
MENLKFAQVAVSAAVYSIDRPYDYLIPEKLRREVLVGSRVVIPFGKGNRRCEGIVLSLLEKCAYKSPKPIESLLDPVPVLSGEQMKLALWMRDRFFCTVYDAVHAMLPSGIWFSGDGKRISDKTVEIAYLGISGEDAAAIADQKKMRAPQQASVLRLLASIGSAAVREICYFTGASVQTVRALQKQGLVSTEHKEVFRRPGYSAIAASEIILTGAQKTVYDGLGALFEKDTAEAALLFGVTGSGKTLVYLSLIKDAVAKGRSAIVLVPEIGLTPQFVSIFAAHFGDSVAVLHSSLTAGERYDEWKRIRQGRVSVVIGTRSAVFAPLCNLGIIIIDEEQERTYKSENAPRYHARDVAKYRCVQENALLLLGSATPSVESMYSAKTGKYHYFELPARYNEKSLPSVIIDDMRPYLCEGKSGSIGTLLRGEIEKNLKNGEQTILFINRRGASNLVVCGECGYTFTCPNCSVSMTYHSANRRLMCHYCGHSVPVRDECPECGGRLKFVGAGTQKVEEELMALFPGVGIIRMDTDTVSPSRSHEKLLARFREGRAQILLGTQMVTKGLDFENVTLVGVISADQLLYINDYRAHERAFSLITQVIGRSGRGEKAGRAVIQTFTPGNEVIRLASKQDYMTFFEREIEIRKIMGSPPVSDLFSLTVSGMDETSVIRGCQKIKKSFEHYFADIGEISILGPAPDSVTKVSNRYRYRVSLSCTNTKRVRNTIAHVMREFSDDKENRHISVYADFDPPD